MTSDPANVLNIEKDSNIYNMFRTVFSRFSDVVLWGAGGRGKAVIEYIQRFGEFDKVVGFIDSSPEAWGKRVSGINVYGPAKFEQISPQAVIITSHAQEEIADSLKEFSFPPERIFKASEILHEMENIQSQSNLFKRWGKISDIQKAVSNFFKYLANLRLQSHTIDNYPFYLVIEPTNRCNLKCFLCGGNNRTSKGANLKFSSFKEILDELGKYLFILNPFKGGDSLIHKDFLPMLRYARKKTGAFMILSSNFSFHLSDKDLCDILECCDHIGICMDGISSETYKKYRVNGNFSLVYNNMLRLVELKREMGSPVEVVWRFIVFRHNEHELELAKEIAESHEIPIEFIKPQVIERSWLPDNKEYWREEYLSPELVECEPKPNRTGQSPCNWLYGSTIINADQTLVPCCEFWPNWGEFGNYRWGRFLDIFNNDEYQIARKGAPAVEGRASGKCINCLPYMRTREANLNMWAKKIQDFILIEKHLVDWTILRDLSDAQMTALVNSSMLSDKLKKIIVNCC